MIRKKTHHTDDGSAVYDPAEAVTVNPVNIGSDFNDFLAEEGILEEVQATALKRVIAYQQKGLK